MPAEQGEPYSPDTIVVCPTPNCGAHHSLLADSCPACGRDRSHHCKECGQLACSVHKPRRAECDCEYAKAVRAAHNGYDAEACHVMPNLTRPDSPANAIRQLVAEARELGRSERDAEVGRLLDGPEREHVCDDPEDCDFCQLVGLMRAAIRSNALAVGGFRTVGKWRLLSGKPPEFTGE